MPDGQQGQGQDNNQEHFAWKKWCIGGLVIGAAIGSGVGFFVALVVGLELGLPKEEQPTTEGGIAGIAIACFVVCTLIGLAIGGIAGVAYGCVCAPSRGRNRVTPSPI